MRIGELSKICISLSAPCWCNCWPDISHINLHYWLYGHTSKQGPFSFRWFCW